MPFVIHDGKKINFIHIPKTGGTTIESWLSSISTLRFKSIGVPQALMYTPQHFTFGDLKAVFGEQFFDYSFAIVRNPYHRLASEYRMQYILGKAGYWNDFETFSNWVDRVFQQRRHSPFMLDNHLRPQWEFVSNSIEIFKFEDGLESITDRVAVATGLPAAFKPLPRHTSSKAFDGKVTWDVKEITMVREIYRQDFEIFGYDVNDVPEPK